MATFVNICRRYQTIVNQKTNTVVNIDLNSTVDSLSQLVSKQLDLSEDMFDLICFGQLLTADQILNSYGIKNGTIVYVINKTHLNPTTNSPTNSQSMDTKTPTNHSEIHQMIIALRMALPNPKFRQMLDKLSETEFRENLIAVTPGLREDPTTFAILQDMDLLATLTEPTNIHKVLAKHPCLLEATLFLAATFHEENIANESTGGPSNLDLLGRPPSYSLDAPIDDDSDDEPMDSQESASNSSATAQRIADMMLRAYQTSRNRDNQSSNQSNSSGIITQDMLSQALRQSIQAAPVNESQPSTSTTQSTAQRLRGWATQLQQMRDLGINDDIVAIQALEATNGDVQAAINIIFSDNN
ncbi:ubiquitin-like protein 7 [Oppia nitens]|uniref:ubiquitin-like protein 7 n=1 Tax=Oppia nitens TaxID=1686743 RepID=UPI0023DAF221|nr:ubiquitin-like protein 7 [Oppia nitens]